MDKHICEYKYDYVRTLEGVFTYSFPTWIARRHCRKCRSLQILVPSFADFNSGNAKWMEETIITGISMQERIKLGRILTGQDF